ncbi:MAG TPA: membrane dipeptidase [Streptosporangiaceae bacterium]
MSSPAVPLATDVGRLPDHPLGLDDAGRARVDRLLGGTVVSLHDHPVRLPDPLDARSWAAHAATGTDVLGEAGLRSSRLSAVLASALASDDLGGLTGWARALRGQLAASADLREALAWADVAGPRTAVFLALEDLGAVGADLNGIDALYGAGFRAAGLTYNAGNPLGGGLGQAVDEGLTALGRDAVRVMERIGMVVDLAHVGDRTSLDAAGAAGAPVMVSHAGARALWPSPRMKPDDVLRAVAATGGVIGVEAAPGSTRVDGRAAHDLDAVMAHVEYVAELVGAAHVALGPDTFFGDHAGLYAAAGWRPTPVPGRDAPLPPYVAGMENPAEAPYNAAAWLVNHGWADADIARVLGGNAARLLGAVL